VFKPSPAKWGEVAGSGSAEAHVEVHATALTLSRTERILFGRKTECKEELSKHKNWSNRANNSTCTLCRWGVTAKISGNLGLQYSPFG